LAAAREYELVLMLDPGQDAPARDAIVQETRGQIEASGALKHENNWGLRKLAYEINRRNEADYRWFRFEAPTELLEGLDHNLKIADGVLRFRIFRVDPDAPVLIPPASAAAAPGASRERPTEAPPRAAAPEPAAQTAVVEAPPEPAAEPSSEPGAETSAAAVAEPAAEAPAENDEAAPESPKPAE
jgi:small subunit ribosomal protein S6